MSRFRNLLLAGSLGVLSPICAAGPPAAITGPEDSALSRLAYSALQGDEALAELNIGVRVHVGGTAVLWGSATAADVARAEVLLKKVPGITGVVNTCDATAGQDALVARVEAAVKNPPPVVAKAAPVPPTKPAAPSSLAAGAPVSRHTTTAEKPVLEPASRRQPAARLLEPIAVAAPVDYAAVEKVRRSDPRYARLTFDLRDGRVVIGGSDSAAAWELARKVAPLVGDRDVVVSRPKDVK